jgi:hypothetical protein
LPVPAGNVVAGGVASDVVYGVVLGNVFAVFPNNDGKLAFVVACGLA